MRQKVIDGLPPVISPLYKHAMHRRKSSDIDIKDGSNPENAQDGGMMSLNEHSS